MGQPAEHLGPNASASFWPDSGQQVETASPKAVIGAASPVEYRRHHFDLLITPSKVTIEARSAALGRQQTETALVAKVCTRRSHVKAKGLQRVICNLIFIRQFGNLVDLTAPPHLALNLPTHQSPANCTRLTSATSTTITAIITVVSKRW